MAKIEHLFITVTVVYLISVFVKCNDDLDELKSISSKLDELLVGIENKPNGYESIKAVECDFGSGGGNQEELSVNNITSIINNALFYETNNYKFFVKNGIFHLAASTRSMFVLNVLNKTDLNITRQYPIHHSGKIFTFEVLTSLNGTSPSENHDKSPIIVVLSVEVAYGTELHWYILSGDNFERFWSWPIQGRVGGLLYFRYKNDHRLMTMIEGSNHSKMHYSNIDIWGFRDNFSTFWLSQRLPASDVRDIKICPAYSGVMLALQVQDDIQIYEYTSENSREGFLEALSSAKSLELNNFVCFQSGQILYLGTSGPNAAILDFFDGEFQFQSAIKEFINEEIIWIETIPVDSYRDEVLVLVQLKNNSIVGIGWQGQTFHSIPLPPFDTADVNLSQITVIPNIGFVYKNKIVRIQTELKELIPPVSGEMEKMLLMKDELTEIMNKQILILETTETYVQNSYLKNPHVTGHWRIKNLRSNHTVIDKGVDLKKISLGNINITQSFLESNPMNTTTSLQKLHLYLEEIHGNSKKAVPANSTEINFPGDLEILGDLIVNKIISKNIKFTKLNNLSITEIHQDLLNYDENIIIEGNKSFSSINVTQLSVNSINGIPLENIVFDKNRLEYTWEHFKNITKLVIIGNVNFSYINDRNWQMLMDTTVSKSRASKIPDKTTIKGLVTSDHINIHKLNGLKYLDYLSKSKKDSIKMTSIKRFKTLKITNLKNLLTINDSSVDDFVMLHKTQKLPKKMTFDNLEITGSLYIDGNITGASRIQDSMTILNETGRLMTRAIFRKLKVKRKIQINESLNGKTWDMFDDLVTKNDQNVEISGKKIFLGVVIMKSVDITSNMINGHHINQFATLDTNQTFTNLKRIQANVTFGKLIRSDLINVEQLFSKSCLNKFMTFKVPPIVEKLFVETFNGNLSSLELMSRLNKTSSHFVYHNLTTNYLHVSNLTIDKINGIDYKVFKSRLISKTKSQELTGNYEINNLDAGMLRAEALNGKSVIDLENERRNLDDLYDKIINGSILINKLTVSGFISTPKVNNITLVDIYDEKATVVFESDVDISELTINGLINHHNFSDIIGDAVMKTDRDIVIKGMTNISAIVCEILDISSWNHQSVDDFLHPINHQVLTGPVLIKNKTVVEKTFDENKKISNVTLKDIRSRFDHVRDNIFALRGNFEFIAESVHVQNLFLKGLIQNTDFYDLHKSVISQNSENTTITGSMLMKNSVKFGNFVITDKFNHHDLSEFYKKVVMIDSFDEFFINKRLSSSGKIYVKKNILVREKIDVKSVMNVDINKLLENAIYLDKPVFIPGTTVIKKAVFSSVKIEKLNSISMTRLISLHNKTLVIPGELRCTNITADHVVIEGTVNGHMLEDIYRETFQLTGFQNISGSFTFLNNVNIRRDFEVSSLNGINPSRWSSVDEDEAFTGELVFNDEVILNGSLRVLGNYNGINPLTWQAIAVSKKFPLVQTISGEWTIHGNVHLKGLVKGSGYLNGTDVRGLIDNLRIRENHLNLIVNKTAEDLKTICKDLQALKTLVNQQIYQLKFFDYRQIINLDSNAVSLHYFESKKSEFLFISLEDCSLNGFIFSEDEFMRGPVIQGFGVIEQWLSLDYKGDKYFVTIGRNACGKTPGNLWRLTDEKMVHIMDLGGVRSGRKIRDYEFMILRGDELLWYSIVDIQERKMNARNYYKFKSEDVKFFEISRDHEHDSNEVKLLDKNSIFNINLNTGNMKTYDHVFGTNGVSRFLVGKFKSEKFVYYNEVIAENYIFISDYDSSSSHIVQTIEAKRPSSIVYVNLDGSEEFLIYIEDCRIVVYEYRGIEGFVYRERLKVEGEKLSTFSLRKSGKCLAVIDGKRVRILEGKMFGERMDTGSYPCDN